MSNNIIIKSDYLAKTVHYRNIMNTYLRFVKSVCSHFVGTLLMESLMKLVLPLITSIASKLLFESWKRLFTLYSIEKPALEFCTRAHCKLFFWKKCKKPANSWFLIFDKILHIVAIINSTQKKTTIELKKEARLSNFNREGINFWQATLAFFPKEQFTVSLVIILAKILTLVFSIE